MDGPGTSRRRFRRAPDEKRARIIEVARAAFSERPYEQTTTAQISRLAGVSEGTIFHHFGTKAGLLRAVAENYAKDLTRAMFSGLDEAPQDLFEVLERGYAFFEKHGVLGLDPRRGGKSEPLRIVHLAIREELVAEGTRLLDRWRAAKLVRPMNTRMVAEILFPILDRLLVESFVYGKQRLSPEYLREAHLCMEGAITWQGPLLH